MSKPPGKRMMSDTVVFDAAGLKSLTERFPHGIAHRYQWRDPAAVPSETAALSQYVNRSAGDLQVTAIAERLGMAL